MSFTFYNTLDEKIQYVAWLLACDSEINVAKGEEYLKDLPDDSARVAANERAIELIKLYNEA